MTTEWWQTFFDGLATEFWNRFTDEAPTAAEADAIVRLLQLRTGDAVLDVPCGNGRHALALAALGMRVHGVDLAPQNVAEALRNARERGLEVAVTTGDMRELPWRGRFDAVVCLGNSFGYFEADAEHARFLRAVAATLRPGGRFVLETTCLEGVLPAFQRQKHFATVGGLQFWSVAEYDPLRGRIDTAYTFARGDEREERQASFRVFPCRQLVELLQESGFLDVRVLGGLDGTAFALGSPRLCLTART